MKIFNAFYDEGRDCSTLIYKEDNVKKVRNFNNPEAYFFVSKTDFFRRKDYFLNMMDAGMIVKCRPVGDYIKVFLRRFVRFDRSELLKGLKSSGIRTFEADLNPLKLLMIDNNVEIEDDLSFLFFDIETDDSGAIDSKKFPILSIAFYSSVSKDFGFLRGDSEKDMLSAFIDVLSSHDVVIGWNSNQFDIPYLKDRFGLNNLFFNWNMVHSVDLMYEFQDNIRSGIESYSLDSIAMRFLGDKKIERNCSILRLFNEFPDLLKEYNVHDVRLLKDLEERFGFVGMKLMLCKRAGVFLGHAYRTNIIDFIILKEARKRNVHFVSVWDADSSSEVIGGLIQKGETGFYDGVCIFDFARQYPNIIISFNISPEKLCKSYSADCVIALNNVDKFGELTEQDKVYFRKDSVGILPSVLINLMKERDAYRGLYADVKSVDERNALKKKENVVKVIMNAFYGQMINPRWRYYNADIGNSVTGAGRWIAKRCKDFLASRGFKVIGGHTDSIFVVMKKDEASSLVVEMNVFINKLLQEYGVISSNVSVKLESFFPKFVFVETSRYIGLDEKGEMKIVGIEMVSAASIGLLKKKQQELLEYVFEGKDSLFMIDFVSSLRANVFSGHVPIEDLVISKSLRKHPKDYKVKPLHVVLTERMCKDDVFVGQKIHYIIKNFKGKGLDRVCLVSDFDGAYDKKYYWEKQVFNPLMAILQVVYPDVDWKFFVDNEKLNKLVNYGC